MSRPQPQDDAGGFSSSALDLQRRLKFLDFAAEDAQRLHQLRELLASSGEAFVEDFYRHLFRFEEAARFLQDEQLVARLKQKQLAHFESILDARFDEAFAQQRRLVGQAHADRGVAPDLFLGSYYQYLRHCTRKLEEADLSSHQRSESMLSLLKVIFLDVGLTLDAYFEQVSLEMKEALSMYWRANNELRQFAQLASHDLKTPLATMANNCDEALDEFGDQIPPEAAELIERAKQGAYRMSRMIDELLEAAVTSHQRGTAGVARLDEVFAEAAERIGRSARAKGVEIKLPQSSPVVAANPATLREAIYNLLANAVKFMDKPAGQGEVAIEAVAEGETVRITVRDNGPGVATEEAERIFAPFRRQHSHRSLPGSGLGLYFTRMIAEQQGGRIWVEPAPGGGARFHLELPRAAAESAPA